MNAGPDREPFSETHLNSPAYRERLMRKLNCLIAVLEVASAKVRRSLAGPDPDVDRLMRIHRNLRETLDMCLRARQALERREELPSELPENLAKVMEPIQKGEAQAGRRPARQFSSAEERQRFEALGPIQAEEVGAIDFDELSRSLFS